MGATYSYGRRASCSFSKHNRKTQFKLFFLGCVFGWGVCGDKRHKYRAWPWPGHCLAMAWPSHGSAMAQPWPGHGSAMAWSRAICKEGVWGGARRPLINLREVCGGFRPPIVREVWGGGALPQNSGRFGGTKPPQWEVWGLAPPTGTWGPGPRATVLFMCQFY